MNKLCRFALLLTLLACLLLPAGASAITGTEIAALRGERSYPQALDLPDALSVAAQSNGVMLRAAGNGYPQPDADKISALADRYIDEIRDIGDAVDFLSVFTTDYVGALVHQANHIQSLYLLCKDDLSTDDQKTAAQTIEDYSLSASKLYSEVEFLTTKLTYCYNRMDVLVGFIQGGKYTPAQTDEYLTELAELFQEAKTRLNDFTDKANLGKLLNDYFTTQLMLTAMETVIDQLHESTEQIVSAGAAALDAAENGSGKLRRADTHVTIVSKSEYVVTVAGPDGSPLEGADVEIHVLDGEGKLTRKLEPKQTNEHGYAIFCFSDFDPDDDGKATIDVWVRTEGYRTQSTGKITAQGGGFVPVALDRDDGNPYIVAANYEGEDILRTDNGIFISPESKSSSTMSFTVNTDRPCTVTLYQIDDKNKEKVAIQYKLDPGNPRYSKQDEEHTTEYTYERLGSYCSNQYFLRKSPVYVRIAWEQDGAQQKEETLTPFVIRKARVTNPIDRNGSNLFMGDYGFTLPKDWPYVGGAQFKLPIASDSYLVNFYIDLNGTVYIGHRWEDAKQPFAATDSQKKRIAHDKKLREDGAGRAMQMFKGIANDYTTLNEQRVVGSMTGSCVPYIMAILRYGSIDDDDEIDFGWNEFQGDLCFGLLLSFNASVTFQPVPFVPFLIGLDFGAGINLGFDIGVKVDIKGRFEDWRNFALSDTTSPFIISPFLDVSASMGLGVPRGAYVGIRGRIYASFDCIMGTPLYVYAQAYARVTIEAVVLWLKKSWTIYNINWADTRGSSRTQTAVLLAAIEESGQSSSAAAADRYLLDPDVYARAGTDEYRTQNGQLKPTSIIRMCYTESANVKFLPISMRFAQSQHKGVSDMGLAMWIENRFVEGFFDPRYRLCYRATSLDGTDDLTGLSPKIFTLDFNLSGDYDIADFDVDYYFKDDNTAPELSVLITAVPHDTPKEQVEQATELYFAQFTAEYGMARNDFDEPTFPTVTFKRKDNSAKRITSIDGKTEKGFIMPRVRVLAGKNEVVLGALHPYAYGSVRYSVMMSHAYAPYSLTSYQEITDPDLEPIEFQLLDRKLIGRGIIENATACFLLLHSKSQESKSRFCMISSSGQGGGSGYSMASIGGGSINLSSFRMIEAYDVRYNRRQVGIGALRTVRDEDTGLYQSRLFLMRLEWDVLSFERLWDSLSPVDTGVTLGTGGFAFMEINGAQYAYWVTSTVNRQGDTVFDVNACYVDIDKQMASKPFSMLSVVDPKRPGFKSENQLAGVTLLPLVRGSDRLHGMFLSSVYMEDGLFSHFVYRWGKFSYAIQIGMEVKALVPDYPVILPGDTFTSTLRVCNTGMLPIYNFDIDFLATPEGSSSANFVTQLHVDMLNLKNNAMRNAAGQTIKSGESAVYRLDDGTKKSNGEIVHLIRYNTHTGLHSDDGQISKWKEQTQTLHVLPADGELTLRASFTAPRDCWGDKTDATLTAMVHGLEAGLDLEKTDATATFAGGRSSAVTMTSAQPVVRSAASGGDEFEKILLSADCVSYAYLDGSGQPTDESDLDLTGNDMTLEADVVLFGGQPTVSITLSNLDGVQAKGVTPMLVAMVDGKETWRYALRTELTSDYTRCLTIPLATLAGGKPYSSIDLYLTSSTLRGDVLDFDAFDEVNDYDNHATLCPVYDFFFVTEPQSTTAFVGQDIELTAEVAGASGPFTYQWVEVNTDGTLRALRGETGTTLMLKAVTLAQNGTKYRCMATNSQGIQRFSNTATLTVCEEPPVTGDTSHTAGWLALLGISGMLLFLVIRRTSSALRD